LLKEKPMNRYDPGTPRTALAIGAAAIATITLVLVVAMPAQTGYDEQASSTITATHDWTRWIARASHQAGKIHLPGKPVNGQPETAGKRAA
jgi:hypothetical protein